MVKKPESKSSAFRPRLFWQLFIAFAALIFLAVCGLLLILRILWGGWDAFPPDHPMSGSRRCASRLAAHYAQHGSWEGGDAVISRRPCLHSGDFREDDSAVILAAADGVIVASDDDGRLGQALSERERDQSTPILVNDQLVGFLLLYSYDSGWDRGRVFFWTGGAIVITGLAVGWLLSRRISRPVVALTRATRAMAAGDLGVRVSVRRRGEIGTLAAAFNRMAARVEETIVTLRRFVSDAAHEINTPLTALRTSLELAPADEHVSQALTQVERLEALTEGLLDLSRIEANAQAEGYVPVDLVPLAEQVSELYASRAEQAGLTFDLALPESPVTVLGDGAQLQRALGNLLDNAVKFTPQGGAVSFELGCDGEWAELRIEDTGIGIPEDDLPQIFSRFHRGRNTATYPGSGLGLAIVKAITEGHGGAVSAQNTARGALFTVRLPLADAIVEAKSVS